VSSLDQLLVWLDSGVCSQTISHSFWLAGRPLPLCARDLGLFGAFLVALPFARGRRGQAWLWGLLPLVIDGANSFAFDALHWSLYDPSNPIRLATGVLAGASLAFAVPFHELVPLPWRWERLGEGTLAIAVTAALLVNPNLGLALFGTAGIVALIATANLLAKPAMARHLAWALALPELTLLATAKYGLLAALR
jgi:uncharacterized membrane protein